MINKLILNTANYSSKNTNASVKFLVNFGFLDPHKHYKCTFAFQSQPAQIPSSLALITFSGGPLANNYVTSRTNSTYIYSPILGTVHTSNYLLNGAVASANLEATTNDNTPIVFYCAPQQSEVVVELLNLDSTIFTCTGGVPEWVLTLSFEEYIIV